MKLLTATTRSQGDRRSDFDWCIPGEVVTPIRVICDRDREDPDGGCGCGRAFGGLSSQKATTTAIVADVDGYSFEDLIEAVRSYREQAGWAQYAKDEDEAAQLAADEAASIAETAAEHEAGTVLEIRLGAVSRRWWAA
jgi:hypothetical protein